MSFEVQNKKKTIFFILLNPYWYSYPWGQLFERKDLHVYSCECRTAWWGMGGQSLWHGAFQPMGRSIHYDNITKDSCSSFRRLLSTLWCLRAFLPRARLSTLLNDNKTAFIREMRCFSLCCHNWHSEFGFLRFLLCIVRSFCCHLFPSQRSAVEQLVQRLLTSWIAGESKFESRWSPAILLILSSRPLLGPPNFLSNGDRELLHCGKSGLGGKMTTHP
jgi:hypothetical protein